MLSKKDTLSVASTKTDNVEEEYKDHNGEMISVDDGNDETNENSYETFEDPDDSWEDDIDENSLEETKESFKSKISSFVLFTQPIKLGPYFHRLKSAHICMILPNQIFFGKKDFLYARFPTKDMLQSRKRSGSKPKSKQVQVCTGVAQL